MFMESWILRVSCKVGYIFARDLKYSLFHALGFTYFARDPKDSWFHEHSKNWIHFWDVYSIDSVAFFSTYATYLYLFTTDMFFLLVWINTFINFLVMSLSLLKREYLTQVWIVVICTILSLWVTILSLWATTWDFQQCGMWDQQRLRL